jgi:hypothetical protein
MINKIRNYFHKQFTQARFFYFNFICLTTIFYLAVEFQHENNTYYNIIKSADRFCTNKTDTGKIKSIVLHVYEMMHDRHKIFRNKEQLSWKHRFFKSVDLDLMYGAGSCGGYSKVLTRSLSLAGYKVRIGQLKVHGYFGGHILMEVFSKEFNKWILIDPLYGVMVTDSTGYPVSYSEAEARWETIKNIFPLRYQEEYHYRGIRYTNWDKYGFASKSVKKLGDLFVGKDTMDTLSFRPLLLSTYKVYLVLVISLFTLYHLFNYYCYRRRCKQKSQD